MGGNLLATRACVRETAASEILPGMQEATLRETENGLVPAGEGWLVVNAREAPWLERTGMRRACPFEGETRLFAELGINVAAIEPGQPSGMYHAENQQEDFLILSGECLLLIEGEEAPASVGLRPLSARDRAHPGRRRGRAMRLRRGRRPQRRARAAISGHPFRAGAWRGGGRGDDLAGGGLRAAPAPSAALPRRRSPRR